MTPSALDAPRNWWRRHVSPASAWRAAMRFQADNMGDKAAGLSYYAMLALFPGLLVALSVLAIAGDEGLVNEAVHFAQRRGADTATAEVVGTLARRATQTSNGALSVALILSFVLAINAASGVFGAAGRALNVAHGAVEHRGFVHRRVTVYGLTLLSALLLVLSIVLIFVGGDWAQKLFDTIGLGSEAARVWDIVRWPVALGLALGALAIVVRYAPAPEARRKAVVTTGAITTVVLWVLATLGFSVYVRNFGNFGALYGAFSAAVILLLWLYLMAMAFLYGAELDGELRRRRVSRAALSDSSGPGAT